MKNFKQVDPKQSFSKLEEEILKFWQENKIFEESIENRKNSEEFNFYDGPPFATGTPHYGHILAGTIKDVIPRYQTMKGFRVDRKFGWDCHGLPIENIVEKKLKISGKDDIEKKIGVYNFNEECRKNVFTYAHEWKKTVERMGRWVDMENDYKTMDTDFMESVWWVYKSIYDKGLIYEGHKVVPYCPRCTTPLSNFEVNQGYKDKQSKTVTLKFRESNSLNKYFLAWTTTPWTVPAVLALAIGKDIDYSEILDKKTKEIYVLATARISSYYKNEDEYTLIKEYKGESLIGTKIEPVFDDFKIQLQEMGKDLGTNIKLGENAFSIISGNHVTTDAGTGIVTTAPGYGEDDFLVAKENKVGFVTHIGDDGKTCNLLDEKNNGVPVFEFNEISLNYLKDSGKTIHIGTIDHSYPHCWRCDNPLIYRGISAWYVAVEKIRNKMVENNQGINWNPEIIKNGRFGKWVEGAIDWNISRNRYWGSAIPIWQNEDKTSEVCIGSIKEMYELNKEYGQIEEKDGKYFYTNKNQENLKNKNIFKAKNVFGIHGFTGNVEKNDFWKSMKKNLKKEGIILNAPQFEEKENTRYFEWENKLNNSNISECDTVIAHSMGCRISMEYIIENKIKLKRLVLVSPAIRNETKEIINLYSELKHDYKNIINYVDEIIIVHSEDDDDIPVEQGEKLSKEINSTFIKLNGFGHFIGEEYKILEGIVEFGFLKEDTLENKNQEVDIHKHFVDEIYLKNENNFKAKNVLGIHGFIRDDKIIDFIEGAKINLEKQNINFDAPVFKKGEDISYINWKEKLDSLNLNKYDTWLCHSLGCRVSMEYIIENKLKLKRLVLVAPGLKCKTDIVNNFYKELKNDFSQIKKFVKELIVIYDEDDKVHEQKGIKELIKLTGANYIKTSGNGHFNIKQLTLIEGIVKFGTPLKRVPEVLDCWFESGSMPYASKHYPFNSENKIKNLVFDFGKVLLNIGSLKEDIKLLDKNIDVDTFSKKYQTEIRKSHGENDDIMYDKIIEFSKLNITKKDILEKCTNNPNLELLKQIPDLAKKYKLYIFSNTTPDFIATFLKKYNIGSYFEKVIQSCDEKTRKPNKDFYEILFKKCNIIPQESLFFDDKKENIEMGENLGMNGFHFTDLNTNIENTIDKINNNFKFPADFIAEGLDQTRGWFYTLLVLGTALFDKAPMKNVIVNGIVLAEDGQKMSKSKQNYPDPKLIFDNYGADAMRFYLMNSPVVEAQDFRFVENGVEEVVKKVILPLWNTYYFFTTYANIDGFEPKGLSKNLKNNLDKWLISELNELTKEVSKGFDEYKLNIASKPIVKFMNNLTNWYIRRSRKRFWKSENDDDKIQAYETLYYTLIETCKIIAPFMPFVSEYIYKNLSKEKSVHLTNFPIYDENLINKSLNEDTDKVQKIITLGLAWRANNKIRVRQPLNSITITENLSSYYNEIIKEELNVKEVLIVDGSTLAKKICKPNGKIIGPKFGSDVKFIISEAKSGNFEELNNGNIKIGKFELESGDFELVFVSEDDKSLIESGFGMVISMDDNITEELKNEGIARDLVRQIQEARKQANYNVDDRIQVCITGVDNILNIFKEYIETETLSNIVKEINLADLEKEIELEELKVNLKLKK